MPEVNHVAPTSSPDVVRASRPHADGPASESAAERKVELKFCECCGGLWFRDQGDSERYCQYCAPAMRQVAVSRKKPCGSVKSVNVSAGRVACV